MGFNGSKITEYKDGEDSATGTLVLGSTFNNEFDRLYANDNYLNDFTEASVQRNLVYNYDFRYFSNQLGTISNWYDYNHPDGWIHSDDGTDGKIGYDTSLNCCIFLTSSDGIEVRKLKQSLHEFVNWKNLLIGKIVTLKAFVKGANAAVILTDGVTSQSFSLQNTGGIEELTLQLTVNTAATELSVSIESSTVSNTIQIYKVYANCGNVAVETLPCIVQGVIGELKTYDATEIPPPGEFELNGIELPEGYSRLDSLLNGKFGRGENGRSNLKDGRGMFERQWANGSINDPDKDLRTDRGDGTAGDRVGTKQGDAIRNIEGSIEMTPWRSNGIGARTGALYTTDTPGNGNNGSYGGINLYFNASRVVPVGADNRPVNTSILKTIRWC